MGTEKVRAFVALDLDPTSVRRVARVADRLRMSSGAPSATWTPPAKMHVTLKFLGEIPADAVAGVGKALGAMVDPKAPPPPVGFRLEAFPSTADAQVVVVELDDPQATLKRLAERVEKIASKHGVPVEARPFRPHVTLARLKRPYDARRWLRDDLATGAGECAVRSLVLYRSDLGKGGSVYVPLAKFDYERA